MTSINTALEGLAHLTALSPMQQFFVVAFGCIVVAVLALMLALRSLPRRGQ